VIYWAWNNVLSISQQWVIMRRMGVTASGQSVKKESPVSKGKTGPTPNTGPKHKTKGKNKSKTD